MNNANAKDIRIQKLVEQVRQQQCRDFQKWIALKCALEELDPHNPQLELSFHGLPYFGGRHS